MLPWTVSSLPYLIKIFIARHTADIYYIVIYCNVVQYSGIGHFSSGGGGGVILSLCRVGGPWRIAPTPRPVDASSRNWIWEVWWEYLENIGE